MKSAYLERLQGLLGRRDPFEVLNESPARMLEVAAHLQDRWQRPWRPGGWTAGEIAAHLCDHELAFGFRLRQTVAAQRQLTGDDEPVRPNAPAAHRAQPYDQNAWARPYRGLDPTLAVQGFVAVRAWNLALLTRLELRDWLASYHQPEEGIDVSIDEAVRRLAGHDLNHLAQLRQVAAG